jgi:hypothetical protein
VERYTRDQLERFLTALDANLATPCEIIVIGGTAAALHYGARRPTTDIDTWNVVSDDLARAIRLATQETGLNVPLTKSGIADGPEDFESRLERVLPHLRQLSVLVPEPHDLVLMKALRAYEHDLEVIEEIHQHSPLDLETLVHRFESEMSPIGNPARIRDSFLLVIERLFPRDVDRIEKRLKRRSRRP